MKISCVFLTNTVNDEIHTMTQEAVNSLKETCSAEFELSIVVVESNQNSDYFYEGVTKLLCPQSPFNFNKFLNLAIKVIDADWYLLCNNDVLFNKGWMENLFGLVRANPSIHSWSPSCESCNSQNYLKDKYPNKSLLMGYTPRQALSGWCILVNSAAMKKIYPLDERFDFYFADNDYAMTLRAHSIKHALAFDSHVTHLEHKKVSKKVTLASHNLSRDKLPWYLRSKQHTWLFENPKMIDGYTVFSQKWGLWYILKLKCLINDFLFLKLNIDVFSKIFFRPKAN